MLQRLWLKTPPDVQTPRMQIPVLLDPINLDFSAKIPGESRCDRHDELLPVQLDCLPTPMSSTVELQCYFNISRLTHNSLLKGTNGSSAAFRQNTGTRIRSILASGEAFAYKSSTDLKPNIGTVSALSNSRTERL